MDHHYDYLVLGAGSGGLASAKRAAGLGARVAIIETSRVGGTCVIRGCIPKKLMYYASHLGRQQRLAEGYGWAHAPERHDWGELVTLRNDEVARLEQLHVRLLDKAGVHLLKGTGRLVGPNEIDVEGARYSADQILIATGGHPMTPPVAGIANTITSDGLWELDERPGSVVLVGGGYIAVEFASILAGLGIGTTLVVRSRLLRKFDHELGDLLADALRNQGVSLHLGAVMERVERTEQGLSVLFADEHGEHRDWCDAAVCFAVGRRPNTQGLGLEEAGVELGPHGQVLVNDEHTTSVSHIHAVGDVIDRANLTPVAIKAGRLLADRLFAGRSVSMSYENIPTAIFSSPPIGTVGLSEEDARAQYGDDVSVYRSRFAPMVYTPMSSSDKPRTLAKLIVRTSTDRVLGCHMIGDDAPEIIQGFAVAVQMGARKEDFDRTIAIHPSSAEEFVLM